MIYGERTLDRSTQIYLLEPLYYYMCVDYALNHKFIGKWRQCRPEQPQAFHKEQMPAEGRGEC